MSYQNACEEDLLQSQELTETNQEKSTFQGNVRIRELQPRFYSSDVYGSIIRDAITGYPNEENIRVGDKEENKFYKVIDATGFYNNKDPKTLYYSDFSQYKIYNP